MPRTYFHPRWTRGRAAWTLLGGIVGVLMLGCLVEAEPARASAPTDSPASIGRQMFFGEASLKGTITGHAEALPPRLVACANCHLGEAGVESATSFAPTLDRLRMVGLRSRRGGPPSVFSPSSFCRLLRTGVDPAYVVITRQMPRYTLNDDQCLGLWGYLMEADDEPSDH